MFIGEAIEVEHEVGTGLLKQPGPPVRFVWREREYEVAEVESAWLDDGSLFKPWHEASRSARLAERQRSWGVGRDFYRVRTECGGVYVVYYDRRPKGREIDSGWFLYEVVDPSPRDG